MSCSYVQAVDCPNILLKVEHLKCIIVPPVTMMLWLASANTVGRGKAVKMEKSCSRDEAARLTRNIITMVKAAMIAMAYTTSTANTNCSSHSWQC